MNIEQEAKHDLEINYVKVLKFIIARIAMMVTVLSMISCFSIMFIGLWFASHHVSYLPNIDIANVCFTLLGVGFLSAILACCVEE